MQRLCQIIEELYIRYKNAVIWITGMLICHTLTGIIIQFLMLFTQQKYITYLLIHLVLEGSVNSPTRGNNILDIYATNRPALTHLVNVIPGISDHEIIKVASNYLSPYLLQELISATRSRGV